MKREDLEFMQHIRCYYGAYDSASQRVIDNQARALKMLSKACEDEIACTFHSAPDVYCVHSWGKIMAEGSTRGAAIANAMEKMNLLTPS